MFGRFNAVRLSLFSMVCALMVFAFSSAAGAEALKLGDDGKYISEIQAKLVNAGYDIEVDGNFGPETLEAVKSFQKDKGLEVDGIVGQITYKALMGRNMPKITRTAPKKADRISSDVSRGGDFVSKRILSTALQYVGTPYVFGGSTPSGFDCSGYVQYVYASVGISIPRTADVQFNVGKPIDKKDIAPGDMVFFSTYEPGPSHVGIYIGDGNFIHASSTGCVKITPLNKQYYVERYLGARRVS